jgi:hypothetical protein
MLKYKGHCSYGRVVAQGISGKYQYNNEISLAFAKGIVA